MVLDVPLSCDFPYVKPLSENQAMLLSLLVRSKALSHASSMLIE